MAFKLKKIQNALNGILTEYNRYLGKNEYFHGSFISILDVLIYCEIVTLKGIEKIVQSFDYLELEIHVEKHLQKWLERMKKLPNPNEGEEPVLEWLDK